MPGPAKLGDTPLPADAKSLETGKAMDWCEGKAGEYKTNHPKKMLEESTWFNRKKKPCSPADFEFGPKVILFQGSSCSMAGLVGGPQSAQHGPLVTDGHGAALWCCKEYLLSCKIYHWSPIIPPKSNAQMIQPPSFVAKKSQQQFNGNFRILKWRYCTICLAIFCGDILWNIGLKNRPS